jgi:gluconokinase
VFDARGVPIPELRVQIGYAPRTDASGASEFDADDLVAHVARAIDAVLNRAGADRRRIEAVGCCSFWHSMVGIDARGAPIGPVYTWADTRPGAVVETLRGRTDERALRARTGCPLHSSYFPARLAWLRATRPVEYERAARWLAPAEYLYLRLFGEPCPSISMASATGLFDQARRDWDDEALDLARIPRSALPTLDPDDPPARGLSPDWARRWPELAGAVWARPIGDGAAGNVGSMCLAPQRAALNLGTSGAIRVGAPEERAADIDGLWRYRIDRSRILVGGAFSDGGNALDWCDQVLAAPAQDRPRRDAHGLTVLPFLGGERSVGWRPWASATVHGLRLQTTASDLRHAFREAVALRFALVFRRLQSAYPGLSEIVLSGGVPARSPDWGQLLADALGVCVRASAEPETSCRGAALVAARHAGLIRAEEEGADLVGEGSRPDPDGHAALQAALVRQEELYARMEAPL